MSTTVVHHIPERRIFAADVGGEEAVIEYERPDEETIDLLRTYVPDAGRGQGIAGRLTRAALAHAEAEGLRVVPTCSYAARYFEKHPEHASLLRE